MILRRVRVRPFGFFADREVAFAEGLNVVLGPNEAGKSTLFNAIKKAFIRSRLTKKELEDHVARFLPAGGGDSAAVELSFTIGGEPYTLARTWGPHPSSLLSLPGGGALSTDDAVKEKLEEILPSTQGTIVRVLMAAQAEIVPDWKELNKSGSLTELDDIVRRAVLQTGGVSVESFKRLLDERHERAFSHWDPQRNLPENGRGIENPWRSKVGEVLEAYYDAEALRDRREKAQAHQQALDEVNGKLRDASAREARLRTFVDANRKPVADARERRTIEAKIEAARERRKALVAIGKEWPVEAEKAERLGREIQDLSAQQAPLLQASKEAAREEENRKLREKRARVSPRAERVKAARTALDAAPRITRKDLDALRDAVETVRRMETGMEAGKLSVTVTARATVHLGVQVDFSQVTGKSLGAGESLALQAGGRILVSHPQLDVEVKSGDGAFEKLQEKLSATRDHRDTLLAAAGAASAEEAERAHSAREAAETELKEAQKSLAEELGPESLASFESRVEALGPAAQTRQLAEVIGQLSALETGIKLKTDERKGHLDKIASWEREHGTLQAVLDAQAAEKAEEIRLSERMADLAPLPPGYGDADAAVKDFEQKEEHLRGLVAEIHELEKQKLVLEERADRETAEEIETQESGARERFQAVLRRGAALQRIQALTRDLLAESDATAYAGMTRELGRLMDRLTASRYRSVDLDGALPLGLRTGSGTPLSWDRLSAGTKDVLALALRLTMASHFLGDASGFLMMDDPLVDMDPGRQSAAAGAIKEFAQQKQVILFTCHPRHAELLGGNRIDL